MTRLFSEHPIEPGTGSYILGEEDSRYLRDVLRMRAGESITVCDPLRTDYEGIIVNPAAKRIEIALGPGTPNQNEAPYEAFLYQGLPKADKMSSVIQKAVELGVSAVYPVACARCVVKVGARESAEKTARWQKVALEAARQSGRGIVPRIHAPDSFREAMDEACRISDLVFIPWEEERSVSFFEALEDFAGRCEPVDFSKNEKPQPEYAQLQRHVPRISIFIGPEGGFDVREIKYAVSKGAIAVSLGKRILRTETAGLAVLSMLLYRLELP